MSQQVKPLWRNGHDVLRRYGDRDSDCNIHLDFFIYILNIWLQCDKNFLFLDELHIVLPTIEFKGKSSTPFLSIR